MYDNSASSAIADASKLNTDEAINFLRWLDPDGWHNLVAISPDTKAIEGKTFAPDSFDDMAAWLAPRNGRVNLYFSVNEPCDEAPDTKLSRDEIAAVRAFHVDFDQDGSAESPEARAQSAVIGKDAPPSAIVNSGNGAWAYWKFDKRPLAEVHAFEKHLKTLALNFGGDKAITDVCRIARLPGTLNIPTAAKALKGRRPAVAALLIEPDEDTHDFDALTTAIAGFPTQVLQPSLPQRAEQTSLIELDQGISAALATAYLIKDAPEAVEHDNGDATTFEVAAKLKDFGISEHLAFDLLLDHWNNDKAIPPWDPVDLREKVRNAFSYGTALPGKLSPAMAGEEFEDETASVKPPPSRFNVQNIGRFEWNSHQKYLVKGLLLRGMVGVLSAPSNAGKSPLILDIAAHIAKGEAWRGMRVTQAHALYVATEGAPGIANRMEALRRAHFENGAGALDFIVSDLDLRNHDRDAKALAATAIERATACGLPPGLIVIDTLSHTLGGSDDSDQEAIRALVKNCKRLAAQTQAAVVLLHHPTKNESSMSRGSGLLINDFDLLAYVEHDLKTGVRTFKTPRVKDYQEISPLKFRCVAAQLGSDQDGDPVTAPIVKWLDSAETEFAVGMTPNDKKWFCAVERAAAAAPHGRTKRSAAVDAYCDLNEVELDAQPRKKIEQAFNAAARRLVESGYLAKLPDKTYVLSAPG